MKQSSPRQKKNCLQNFDLSEHRQIISDLAIHIYHQFISVLEKSLLPAIGNSPLDATQMFHMQLHLIGPPFIQFPACWSTRACRASPA